MSALKVHRNHYAAEATGTDAQCALLQRSKGEHRRKVEDTVNQQQPVVRAPKIGNGLSLFSSNTRDQMMFWELITMIRSIRYM